jgi:LysR family transcriptional regulator, low CO2-responsive transcriptional regulator
MHATLQQLRLFLAVAEHGSFTRAAQAVHLSQPAVSIQVKRLEEQVGLPLFEQIGKRIYLTHAGKLLHDACSDIFLRLENLNMALDTLRGEVAGPLRLTVVTTAKYFLPEYLGAFLRRYPGVQPALKVTNRRRVLERIEQNEDDFYILGTLPEDKNLEIHPFLDDELVVFAHPEHPLARQRSIPLQRLSEERVLFREEGSGIRFQLERYFRERNLVITPYMELGSGEAIKQAVIANLGISIISTFSLELELNSNLVAILDVEGFPIPRQWSIVYPRGKSLSLVAQRFLDFLLKRA